MKNYLLSALIVAGLSAPTCSHAQADLAKVLKLGFELSTAACALAGTPEVLGRCLQIPGIPHYTSFFKGKYPRNANNEKIQKTRINSLPVTLVWGAATYYSIKKLLKRTKDLKKINIKKQS